MRQVIFFLPYLMIPFLVAWISIKNLKYPVIRTYYITGFLILIYPFIHYSIDEYLNPPHADATRCDNVRFGLVMANLIFLLPITLGIQYLMNAVFIRR